MTAGLLFACGALLVAATIQSATGFGFAGRGVLAIVTGVAATTG